MWIPVLVGLLLILAGAASPISAQEPTTRIRVDVIEEASKNDKWEEVHAPNLRIVGNAGAKTLRKIAVDLEELREQFLRVFPYAKSSGATTVVVFRNDKLFRPFQRPDLGERGKNTGYVHAGPDRNYVVVNGSEKNRRDVYHDYIHLLIAKYPFPLWLREGLAEYYGGILNERYLVGDHRTVATGFPIYSHEGRLRDAKLLPLAELFKVREDSPNYDENDRKSVFLAESWALVHWLHQPAALDLFNRFLHSLALGVPAEQSFREAFHVDLPALEEGFRGYIRDSRSFGWSFTRTPYCMCNSSPLDWQQFNFDDLQTTIKDGGSLALTEAKRRFYLGELLRHRGELQDARVYLESAIQMEPGLVAAHASLGALWMTENQPDKARESIRRALSLGADDPLTYYYDAVLIRADAANAGAALSAEQLEAMRKALTKAVHLAPQMDDAATMLAEVHVLMGRPELNALPSVAKKDVLVIPPPARRRLADELGVVDVKDIPTRK